MKMWLLANRKKISDFLSTELWVNFFVSKAVWLIAD